MTRQQSAFWWVHLLWPTSSQHVVDCNNTAQYNHHGPTREQQHWRDTERHRSQKGEACHKHTFGKCTVLLIRKPLNVKPKRTFGTVHFWTSYTGPLYVRTHISALMGAWPNVALVRFIDTSHMTYKATVLSAIVRWVLLRKFTQLPCLECVFPHAYGKLDSFMGEFHIVGTFLGGLFKPQIHPHTWSRL